MNDEEKYKILYYNIGVIRDGSVISNVNDFFDESFVNYLINNDEMYTMQLVVGLECIDFSKIILSEPLSNRDKILIIYLINLNINISSIINNMNESQYNECAKYLKDLYELNTIDIRAMLCTNDISIINSVDVVINDYKMLYRCLTNFNIDDNIKKYLFTYKEIRELFINTFNVWEFYDLVDKLKLDESYIEEREYKLRECIFNPSINISDFREIICELICKDSYNNFMLNLEMIYNYCASEKDIPNELGVSINYMMLVKDLLLEEDISKIDINFLMKNYRVIGDFYNKSINLIKTNFNNKLNSKLASGDIYFVHTEMSFKFKETDDIKKLYSNRLRHPSKRVSFSLLNSERTGIYGGINNSIVFGYNKTPNNLLVAGLGDARTAQSRVWTRGSYLSIDDYLASTSSDHNELLYEDIEEVILPDYLISFHEEATELEQRVAEEFNIPIKYLKYNSLGDDNLLPDKEYKYDYNEINYITNNLNINKTL